MASSLSNQECPKWPEDSCCKAVVYWKQTSPGQRQILITVLSLSEKSKQQVQTRSLEVGIVEEVINH